MDRECRPRMRVRFNVAALLLAALGGLTPSAAVVPYQGWTPASFGMVPECGKYETYGYLTPGCLITRRIRFSPHIKGFGMVGTLGHGAWVTTTGATWTPITPHCLSTLGTVKNVTQGTLPCGVEDIVYDPIDSRTIYVSTYQASSPLLPSLAFDPGGVFKSTDLGVSWTLISQGVSNLRGAGLAVIHTPGQKATIMVGNLQHADHDTGSSRSLAISYDDGASWRSVRFTPPKKCARHVVSASTDLVAAIAVNPTNPNIVYAGSNGGLYQTTDRGRTWSLILSNCFLQGKVNIGSVWGITPAPDGRSLYAGMWDGTVRVASTSRPTSWRTITKLNGWQITSMMLDVRDPTGKTLYVGTLKQQPGQTARAAGVYRLRTGPKVSATLLSDSYLAGINHELGRNAPPLSGLVTLVQNAPALSLAQSPFDPDVIYLSQVAGGIFWRSEGPPAPSAQNPVPQPSIPGLPTAMPSVAPPATPTSLPTAIPTSTPTGPVQG